MRIGSIAVAVALFSAVQARAETPVERAANTVDQAIPKDDCKAGLPAARVLFADPRFGSLANDQKLRLLSFAANCALRLKTPEEAYADVRAATKLAKADDWLWTTRIELAIELNRPDDVVEAVQSLTMVSPSALNAVDPQFFYRFRRDETAAGRAAEVKHVFAMLEKVGYAPSDPIQSPDGVWWDYARLVDSDGDTAHAAALISRIGDIKSLMAISFDPQFGPIVASEPDHFDLRAAQERQLQRDEAAMKVSPDLLQLVIRTIRDLRALGRFDDALALDQSTIDRASRDSKDALGFKDLDRWLNWAMEAKADILFELGREDEALEIERAAAKVSEGGHPNVSQVINLAEHLEADRRAPEALDTLRVFDSGRAVSPFGAGWIHAERACAGQQLGHNTEVATELAYLDDHATDNPLARIKAYLCVNDTDGAAQAVIAELHDPNRRLQGLISLSEFDLRASLLPLEAERLARLKEVGARPDVKAAIAAAGGIQHIHLSRDVFVDD